MKILGKLIILVISNALAVFVATRFVSGITIEPTLLHFIEAGAVLGLVNTFIKPIIKFFSFPFIILTLGLFTIVINIILLFFVSFILPSFAIETISAAFWGVVLISLVNYLISIIIDN